jgi:phosphoglycolate phosphatase-like HAD superfamily hydrolase
VRTERGLLFLDFDGVICDSIEECFSSSAIAFYKLMKGEAQPDFDAAYRKSYRAHRPFVRNGEDYLLIHELLSRGAPCSTQADYDRAREAAGKAKLERYLELFTQARRDLVANRRAYWISLNPVYPFMCALLPALGADSGAYILSTKKKEFIVEILASCGVEWWSERIISMQDSPKLGAIKKLLDDSGAARAAFIDDQIEHLTGAADPRIDRYLALWGYALPGAKADGVRELNAREAEALLKDFLKS